MNGQPLKRAGDRVSSFGFYRDTKLNGGWKGPTLFAEILYVALLQ